MSIWWYMLGWGAVWVPLLAFMLYTYLTRP